jgi:hypothetical protein
LQPKETTSEAVEVAEAAEADSAEVDDSNSCEDINGGRFFEVKSLQSTVIIGVYTVCVYKSV